MGVKGDVAYHDSIDIHDLVVWYELDIHVTPCGIIRGDPFFHQTLLDVADNSVHAACCGQTSDCAQRVGFWHRVRVRIRRVLCTLQAKYEVSHVSGN